MKNQKIKITFFDAKPYDIKFFEQENKNFDYELKFFEGHLTEDTAIVAHGSEVVCVFVNDAVSSEIIDILLAGGTKLIALRCAGYNNVDLKASYEKMHVVRVPAYSPYAVAEYAMALILTLNRKTHKVYSRIRDNNFSISGFLGFDLHGRTAGVVGTGNIGKVMAKILRGFGMRVLLYDLYPDEAFAKENGSEYVELEVLLRESDIISLHCPLNDETYHLIDTESIAKMKTGVMIINTSRGHLIDTAALIEGLKTQKIGSAGLDVYEEESEYFFEDKSDTVMTDDKLARIISFNNVLVSSHQGFFTVDALTNISATTLQNIDDFFNDRHLKNEICYRCGKTPCPMKTGEVKRCF
jgi:D-lactate dehydrogenase